MARLDRFLRAVQRRFLMRLPNVDVQRVDRLPAVPRRGDVRHPALNAADSVPRLHHVVPLVQMAKNVAQVFVPIVEFKRGALHIVGH
jgi:hypothetical protein